jgi:hypothetical protein
MGPSGDREARIAAAKAHLREAQTWLATLRYRAGYGIVDPPEVEAHLQAALAAAEAATAVAAAVPADVEAWREDVERWRRTKVAPPHQAPLPPPPVAIPAGDFWEESVAIAKQRHLAVRREARYRKAAAVKAAHAQAQRAAARRALVAARRRTLAPPDANKRAGRTESGGFPTELLQRSQDVRAPYAVNFRETYADDAFYLDAIEPYTWGWGKPPAG